MSRLTVTNFTKRTGSPFQKGKVSPKPTKIVHQQVIEKSMLEKKKEKQSEMMQKLNSKETNIVHEEVIEKTTFDKEKEKQSELIQKVNTKETEIVHEEVIEKTALEKQKEKQSDVMQKVNKKEMEIVYEEVIEKSAFEIQKEKQSELMQKVNKKTAEYQSNKPSSGVFTEVVTHGAFTSKTANKHAKVESPTPPKTSTNGSKSFLGFPSSANDLALDAKSDLETDPNISAEVKEKVIQKLFGLVSMVQHVYESKVRIMTEFEKYKDTHMKNEIRREKEHSEQLYKLNMNFQNEVVQSIQRLKSELDISRNVSRNIEESSSGHSLKDTSIDFNTTDDAVDSDTNEKGIDTVEETKTTDSNSDILEDESLAEVNKDE